ncbi:beta-propeller fold lactonase family protein [Sorangium sp. So ce1153]|uniref:beta-propeller fold lactonase family protein n=1 Tax=Sorangium sp. So ce1153 TaxID=3133333 RepID=UPI003F5DE925
MNRLPGSRWATLGALVASLTAISLSSAPALAAPSFTAFESGQVRPLAISPDKKLLFAVNTPDNRLEVFRIGTSGLEHRASISVGLEPVAVAARSNNEVWVVNHLSDSVSVVQLGLGGNTGRVVRTLLVGDEPRDIVFAGPGRDRAFITTAHRGQNSPIDPQLTTPGVGRADVWVFNANNLGSSLGGNPLNIITLFSDTPRALAVTPDGTRVYAAAFHSGNRTATVNEALVPDGFGPNGVPGPSTNFEGVPAPETAIIVKYDGGHWYDERGGIWDDQMRFSLPDKDVFVIDATANPPAWISGAQGFFSGVGTVLFNMTVNPVNGKVYVANTEAFSQQSFEGPGIYAGETARGHLHESRITVLSPGSVAPRHLNKHIDYSTCCAPVPNAENAKSLAFPQEMVVTSNGATLYVAALGSSKIGVFSTAALENNTFVPSTTNQIPVSGGGPTGLVLDEAKNRLYVLTRFDNSISIINTTTKTEVGHVPMYNPEPDSIVNGRRFLYDASLTSSHGDSACASCHVFGDQDDLAWNLGNPDGSVVADPGPFPFGLQDVIINQPITNPIFHPMKGPMMTQSLRGLANHGPMHWRGDRTGGYSEPSAQPDEGSFDERAAFEQFQVAFPDLLGRSAPIPAQDMEAFTDFMLQVTYPPNPIRNLDNSLTPDQQAGKDFFNGDIVNSIASCGGCHVVDPDANPGADFPGLFGTSGGSVFDFQTQLFKIPQLRNVYTKVGAFGLPDIPFVFLARDNDHMGDQIRGFGILNNGTVDTMFRFFSAFGFSDQFPNNEDAIPFTPAGDVIRRQLEAYVLAIESNMAPIVGQQVTLNHNNGTVAGPRIDLLMDRADLGECDLVAKTQGFLHEVGFLYVGGGQFLTDRQILPPISDGVLRLLATQTHHDLTYTCAPPGSGARAGIDRDSDGFLDGDELDCGSDPADPSSTP